MLLREEISQSVESLDHAKRCTVEVKVIVMSRVAWAEKDAENTTVAEQFANDLSQEARVKLLFG